jgi:hypothetical protein
MNPDASLGQLTKLGLVVGRWSPFRLVVKIQKIDLKSSFGEEGGQFKYVSLGS